MKDNNQMQEELDKEIQHALDQMISPVQMNEEDVKRILNNPKEKEIARDIHLLKDCLVRSSVVHRPYVEGEWAKFKQRSSVNKKNSIQKKSNRRYFIFGTSIGIAASLVLVITLLMNNWLSHVTVVYRASNEAQHTMLFTSTGSFDLNVEDAQEAYNETESDQINITDNLLTYNKDVEVEKETEGQEIHVLKTPIGQDFKVELSDGTIVWLNAESRLEYPTKFTGNARMVYLQGEAYFEVAHDEEHPFYIQTQTLRTKVLGTEFNISSYSETNSHVTLVNGRVEVSRSDGSRTVALKPGQDALLTVDGNFTVQHVDTDNYYFWKEGYFYFDNVPLVDIMQNIGRWYNVNVIFNAKDHLDDRMHIFCTRRDGIENVIQVINGTRRVNIKLEGKTLYIE